MRLPDLRELDRRLVPAAARRLRAAVDAVEAVRRRGLAGARTARTAAATWLTAAAASLDRRYASSGPLARLREVPLVGVAVVVAVLLAGAAAAVVLTEPPPEPTVVSPGGDNLVLRTASLGVPPGADVDEHLAQARVLLEELALRRPDARFLALVSLDRYLPVGAADALVDSATPQRAYLRATGLDGAEIVEVPFATAGSTSVLPALCSATASRKRAEAESLRRLAAAIEPAGPEQQAQQAEFAAQADRADAEAEAYSGECPTLFALVVEAEADVLRALLDRESVRGVEVAPAGLTATELVVTPLAPEAEGRLPTGTER
ncbi:MAG TPA: hypothetical protein VM433_04495 [Mycobacteriales bacterium]|nr:hypothetical protein [Mycobacteriales bacterium]